MCIEGESCSNPAPGVYSVAAPKHRRGSGVTPHSVRVLKGRIAHVALEIDTGIQ